MLPSGKYDRLRDFAPSALRKERGGGQRQGRAESLLRGDDAREIRPPYDVYGAAARTRRALRAILCRFRGFFRMGKVYLGGGIVRAALSGTDCARHSSRFRIDGFHRQSVFLGISVQRHGAPFGKKLRHGAFEGTGRRKAEGVRAGVFFRSRFIRRKSGIRGGRHGKNGASPGNRVPCFSGTFRFFAVTERIRRRISAGDCLAGAWPNEKRKGFARGAVCSFGGEKAGGSFVQSCFFRAVGHAAVSGTTVPCLSSRGGDVA